MKVLSIIFLFFSFTLFASNNVRVNFNLYNSSTPNKKFTFGFGINEQAGDSVDIHLGELSYPPFPPSFDAGLEYIDSTKTNLDGSKYYDLIRTNLDLRSIPENKEKWQNRHKLVINWINAPTVIIEWNSTMIPDIVDSIMIRDMLGGVVINQNMKKTSKLILDNDAIDKLYFDIYYNLNPTSVNEENESNLILFPNPFSNNININSSFKYDEFVVFDLKGNVLLNNDNISNLNKLNTGTYFVIFKLNNIIIERQLISKY